MSSCCSPSRGDGNGPGDAGGRPVVATSSSASERVETSAGTLPADLLDVPAATVRVGSSEPDFPEEHPEREVRLPGFRIAATAVTTDQYAAFAAATGWVSDAERYGWSFVFGGFLPDDFPPTRGVAQAPWWREVHGADWAHPEGPHSDLAGRGDHPVVHVSRRDAEAYAAWAGGRLPSEDEWETAARGGLAGLPFPWGDELEPGGEHRMNVWQGTFPSHDTRADGWAGTCPVDAFEPNGLGLHNTTGNVWEWCAGDWSPTDPAAVSRGGSYLCHASYCRRYRVSARQPHSADSSAGNVGFRIAADA